mmetsp:Transcript_86984/g.227048  ORF Transcript_86984/g.227048 Transcript_86984/m.227048 type:complete len:268 (-) Transcript_86984:28-831(-)
MNNGTRCNAANNGIRILHHLLQATVGVSIPSRRYLCDCASHSQSHGPFGLALGKHNQCIHDNRVAFLSEFPECPDRSPSRAHRCGTELAACCGDGGRVSASTDKAWQGTGGGRCHTLVCISKSRAQSSNSQTRNILGIWSLQALGQRYKCHDRCPPDLGAAAAKTSGCEHNDAMLAADRAARSGATADDGVTNDGRECTKCRCLPSCPQQLRCPDDNAGSAALSTTSTACTRSADGAAMAVDRSVSGASSAATTDRQQRGHERSTDR